VIVIPRWVDEPAPDGLSAEPASSDDPEPLPGVVGVERAAVVAGATAWVEAVVVVDVAFVVVDAIVARGVSGADAATRSTRVGLLL